MSAGRAFTVAIVMGAALALTGSARAQLVPEVKLRISGPGPGQNFGACVARGGDINGDGYDDFLVGAPKAPGTRNEAGRVYVVLGGADLDSVPDLMIQGRYASGHFGASVAGVGDFNGDGYDDYVVGNPEYNLGLVSGTYGRAWVYFGGARLSDVNQYTIAPPANVFAFGLTVAGLGDVNGDGWPDFAVAGQATSSGQGTVSIFLGGPGQDGFSDYTLQLGTSTSAWEVAGPGDLNGDGYNDIIVGTHGSTAASAGRVKVFLGGPVLSDQPAYTIVSPELGDLFGYSVAGAGDVNRDGYPDFLVSMPAAAVNGLPGAGKVQLFYGGPTLNLTPALELHGQSGNGNFGYSVAGAGDLDGDGYADFVVGATRVGGAGPNAGRAYVYFGGAPPDTVPGATFSGEAANDNLGVSVARAGDPDLGGTDALLVGSLLNDAGGTDAGRVYLLRVERYRVTAPVAGDHWTASGTATVKWDGADLADLELTLDGGAHWSLLASGVGGAASNQLEVAVPDQVSGRARLRIRRSAQSAVSGNATLSTGYFHVTRATPAPGAVLEDPVRDHGPDRLGRSVACGVDWNGDGFPDVIVGASPNPEGAIVVKSEPGAPAFEQRIAGSNPGEDFGAAVADIGDFDGDGYADLAVGAPGYSGVRSDAGRVYLYRGGVAGDPTPFLTLGATGTGELFGSAIASADLNGDGFRDLVVGAPGSNGLGHVYVFLGGPMRDATPDAVLDGGIPGAFGAAVSGAGDINGDGYDDLLVSAPPTANGSGAGTVHVFFGGPNVQQMKRTVIEGGEIGDGFGAALAALGDFDGDGFEDFAVGAPLANTSAPDAGEVRLFFGSPDLHPHLGRVLTGAQAGDQFGSALAGGTDLNADGRPDLAIGSPGSSHDGPQSGRIDVLFGGSDSQLDLVAHGLGGSYLGTTLAVRAVGSDSLLSVIAAGSPYAPELALFPITRWQVRPLDPTQWLVGSTQRLTWNGAERGDLWFEGLAGESPVQLASAVGGLGGNELDLLVPGTLPDSGRVVIRPVAGGPIGRAVSQETIRVQRSVTLASFTFVAGDNGVTLNWVSDPPAGPAGVSGFRVRRIRAGGSEPGELLDPGTLVTKTLVDPDGLAGDTYVLIAVNGVGDEIEAGRLTLPAAPAGVRVWPQPGGENGIVNVQFAAPRTSDGRVASDVLAELFDARGRWINTLVNGQPGTRLGLVNVTWDGRNHDHTSAGPGVYFLRVRSASAHFSLTRRVVMLDTPSR